MVVQRPWINKIIKILDAEGDVQSSLNPFLVSAVQAWTSFHCKEKRIRIERYTCLDGKSNQKKGKTHQVWERPTYATTCAPHPKLCQKQFPSPVHRQRSTYTFNHKKKKRNHGQPQTSYTRDGIQNTHNWSRVLSGKCIETRLTLSRFPYERTPRST